MIKKRDARIGLAVKTTVRMKWHGLDIPAGTPGALQGVEPRQPAAMVKFDDGEKFGSFVYWLRELRVDPAPTMRMVEIKR